MKIRMVSSFYHQKYKRKIQFTLRSLIKEIKEQIRYDFYIINIFRDTFITISIYMYKRTYPKRRRGEPKGDDERRA